jgi:hypothetical protein
MSSRTMLAGVALCHPFEQGDLDNLCGLYAALNALCLVSAPIRPLSQAEAKHVLHAGVAFLQRQRCLSDALLHGMALRRQRAVTQHMTKKVEQITHIKFLARQLCPDRSNMAKDAALQLIASRLKAGSAIITCLENTFRHYTVISGVSASRVHLFDSDGLHWIERRSFGICGPKVEARHCVSLTSLIEISVVSA